MKTMHLFAGVGGGLLCDLILGHKPIVAVEWDKYACQVLRERASDGWFPGLQVWEGDVRLFNPSEYAGRVDCIHAGFPCQDISNAGKQAGVEEGTRSGLYREVLRIAGVVRPKFLFLENVSAILSVGLGTVLGDLASRGYDARWLCIKASDVGANHRRDRWFLFAKFIETGYGYEQYSKHEKDKVVLLANSDSSQCEREGWAKTFRYIMPEYSCGEYGKHREWWKTEPGLGRVANGVPDRVGKLKGYGNAQVPLQAAVAFSLLYEGLQ